MKKEILLKVNDIEIPDNGTITLIIHSNKDVYLGTAVKDVKIGTAIEMPSHGSLVDTEETIGHWDPEMMIIDRHSMREFLNRVPIVLEANNESRDAER